VRVKVAVRVGGAVTVAVEVGAGVSVAGNKIFPAPAQDCNKRLANKPTIRYLRIHDLFHAIIL
jgi:hypothetical protein